MQANGKAGQDIDSLLREVSVSKETIRLESIKNKDNDS